MSRDPPAHASASHGSHPDPFAEYNATLKLCDELLGTAATSYDETLAKLDAEIVGLKARLQDSQGAASDRQQLIRRLEADLAESKATIDILQAAVAAASARKVLPSPPGAERPAAGGENG